MANLKTKRGTQLTKERVESLASEAERGYDLSKAARETVRPAGRRSAAASRRGSAIAWQETCTLGRRAMRRPKGEPSARSPRRP